MADPAKTTSHSVDGNEMRRQGASRGKAPLVVRKASRFRAPLFFVACLAITAAGFRLGSALVVPGSRRNHGLVIDRERLNLGVLWARKRLLHVLEIRNATSDEIEIVKWVTGACNCATVTPDRLRIPAGETRAVRVAMDLTSLPYGEQPGAAKDISIDLAAVMEGSPLAAHWRLAGTVRTPVVVSPAALNWDVGALNARTTPYDPKVVEISCVPEVEGVKASCDPQHARVAVDSAPGGAQMNCYRLAVTPADALRVGPVAFTVKIVVAIGAEEFETTPLFVQGVVVDDPGFLPGPVRFEPAPVGEILTQQVIALSRTQEPFTIESLAVADEGLTIEQTAPQTLSDAHVLVVRQEVLEAGPHSSSVRVTVRFAHGELRPVALEVSCYGVRREE